MQIGHVVRDLEQSIATYSAKLELGPWDVYTFQTPELENAIYRGKPIEHSFLVAIAKTATCELELIQPLTGTNIYTEFLEQKGEGLHHLKEWVDDCNQALEEYKRRGIQVLQSGKFGEDEHYYLDTEGVLGIIYEIGNNRNTRQPHRRLG